LPFLTIYARFSGLWRHTRVGAAAPSVTPSVPANLPIRTAA